MTGLGATGAAPPFGEGSSTMQRNAVPVGAFVQQLTLCSINLLVFDSVCDLFLLENGPKLSALLSSTTVLARVEIRCAGKSGRRDFVDP